MGIISVCDWIGYDSVMAFLPMQRRSIALRELFGLTGLGRVLMVLLLAIQPVQAKQPKLRRILYNLDGDSCLTLKAGRTGPGPVGVEDLKQIVTELTQKGSQVDSLLVCVNARFTYYPSRVGTLRGAESTPVERMNWSAHERQREANVAALLGAGTDPYAVIFAEARKKGLEALLTFRMNDAHGNDFLRTAFWQRHPEFRLGTGGALDFGQAEVREYVFRLLEEAVQRYDCDGLELDFQRFPTFFYGGRSGENSEKMSAWVERTRQMLRAEGAKRGRELVLGVRVPSDYGTSSPTPLQAKTPARACDVGLWCRNGWTDFLVVSEFLFTCEALDLSAWRKEGATIPVYAG